MNILFVTDLCPINDEENLPIVLQNFILDFKKLEHNVTLLRPNVIPNVLIRKRKIYKDATTFYKGIKCINKNFLTPFFKLSDFKFLSGDKYDVILSHMPSGILAANKISKLLNIPYYASVHSSDIKVLSDKKYSFLFHSMKMAYLEAANVLPRSYWLKDKITELIPEVKAKTYIVPSGINSEYLLNDKHIYKKAQKFYGIPLKIFSVGQLIKRKNFKNLILAISEIEDIELLIAGEGPEKKNLTRLIKALNLENRVKLLGKLEHLEVLKHMENIPVFILPSLFETFGMVYLEALAKASVVICSENSGMAGFIKNGYNGFLTKTDKNSIKETLEHIKNLVNPEEIMQNAYNSALNMDRLKMAENYLNIIQNILV